MIRLRYGRVAGQGVERHTIRVTFSDVGTDDEEMQSHDLPMLVARPGDFCLPANGALVACMVEEGTAPNGVILGVLYSDEDAPPLDDAGQRSIASNDLRLADPTATDAVALAPATKGEIQKVLDYAKGISDAINNAAPFVPNDGGASVVSAMRVILALNIAPTLVEPAAEKVKAK